MAARIGELALDIGGERLPRVAAGVEFAQGLEPHVEGALQDGAVKRLLAAEVIEQVRLRQPGGCGDLVDAGAAEAVGREDLEGGVEDALGIGLAGPGQPRRRHRPAHLVSHETTLYAAAPSGP